MTRACTNLAHPAAKGGPEVTVNGLRFTSLICPACGREQGRRLIRRTATPKVKP